MSKVKSGKREVLKNLVVAALEVGAAIVITKEAS